MSLREDLGFEDILTKEEKSRKNKVAGKLKAARKAYRRGDFAGAARHLVEPEEDLLESAPVESAKDPKPEPAIAAIPKEVKPAEPAKPNKADEIISQMEEAAKAKTEQKAEPVKATEPQEAKTEPEEINAEEAEKADEAKKISDREQRTLPFRPPVEKSVMNPDLDFYNHKLGNMAYRFDAGLDEMPAKELHDYVKSVIARDTEIIGEIVSEYLPEIIGKNPQMIPEIMGMIRSSEDRNIPIRALYVNARDPESEEFETWEEAKASIAREVELYGVKPEDVFTTIWREIDSEGNLGNQLFESEVRNYIADYHGDQERLKKLLHISDKPSSRKGGSKTKKPADKNSGA